MIDIIPSRDCGNSPKNQFAEQIAVALETGDIDFLKDALDEEIRWETPQDDMTGSKQVLAELEKIDTPSHLRIDHVVTHGKAGAVNGIVQFGDDKHTKRFCHVLTFTNAKCRTLRQITSFSG